MATRAQWDPRGPGGLPEELRLAEVALQVRRTVQQRGDGERDDGHCTQRQTEGRVGEEGEPKKRGGGPYAAMVECLKCSSIADKSGGGFVPQPSLVIEHSPGAYGAPGLAWLGGLTGEDGRAGEEDEAVERGQEGRGGQAPRQPHAHAAQAPRTRQLQPEGKAERGGWDTTGGDQGKEGQQTRPTPKGVVPAMGPRKDQGPAAIEAGCWWGLPRPAGRGQPGWRPARPRAPACRRGGPGRGA